MVRPHKKADSNLMGYVLLVLVVIGLSIYAYTQLDYRIEKVDKGFQGEALTNSFLAAEYFLRSMGQPAEEIKLFAQEVQPLAEADTLLISSDRLAFDSRKSAELMQWVNDGGHLIITARATSDDDTQRARDYILDDLGLHIEWTALGDDDEDYSEPVNVAIDDEDFFWLLDFSDYLNIVLEDEFEQDVLWSIEENNRIYAMQMMAGEGRLTVLADMSIFKNYGIDKHDHAAFLYSLANDQLRHSDEGVFYYSLFEKHINLMQWLTQNARPLVISFVIFVVTVLWMIIPRFGPLINVQQPVRRRFLDHLSAAGNYHWRQGHYARLLQVVRKQLSQQIQGRYPEWINLTREDQVRQLSELSGIEAVVIEHALFDAEIERVDHFIKKIHILEKLRKSL